MLALNFRNEAPALRHGGHDRRTVRRLRFIPSVRQLAERLATGYTRERIVPIGLRGSWRPPIRIPFETDEENYSALLLGNPQRCHDISAILLGSETVKVLMHSKIPVLVHR